MAEHSGFGWVALRFWRRIIFKLMQHVGAMTNDSSELQTRHLFPFKGKFPFSFPFSHEATLSLDPRGPKSVKQCERQLPVAIDERFLSNIAWTERSSSPIKCSSLETIQQLTHSGWAKACTAPWEGLCSNCHRLGVLQGEKGGFVV